MFSDTYVERQVKMLIEQPDSGVEVCKSPDGKRFVFSPVIRVNQNRVDLDDDLVHSESDQFIANS